MADEALARALAALRRKERTIAELDAWLAERAVPEGERAEVVVRLIEVGELDDRRFALRFAQDKRELAGWGAERIREALAARGVGEPEISEALADDGEPAQVERAEALLRRRAGRLDDDRKRGRALSYLTRRGYAYEVAHAAIRRLERNAA
jgi:regulatory protein